MKNKIQSSFAGGLSPAGRANSKLQKEPFMKRFFFALVTLCLLTVAAFGQSTTSTLSGTVSDASGVIQNATVVIKDNKTNRERTVQTNESGLFVVPDVDVGTYTVTVTAGGHKTFTATEVKVDAGKPYSLPVMMEVGDVKENVTVVAGADIVNTTDAQLATNIGPRQLLELPLLTRNPLALILTSSGSSSNPSQNTSINGQRTSATNIVRDGVNINDNFIRSNATDFAPQRPSVDDIGEFTIATQNGADAGIGGAQLTLATPRGANAFHGALFEYNRNSRFAANSFFNNALGTYGPNDTLVLAGKKNVGDPRGPRPFRNRNQYGGKASGKIIKDKLFFFGYYEGLKDIVSSNDLTTTLTPAALTGGFTYNRSDNGALQTVNILQAAFGTGITAIDPTIQSRILARLPGGNTPEAGDGRNTTGYRFSQQANQDRRSFTTRIDYDMSARNSINGVYNHVHEGNLRNDVDTAFNTTPVVNQPSDNDFLSLGWRSSFSSRFSNELTGGSFYSRPFFFSNEPAKNTNFIVPTLVTNPEVTFLNQGRKVRTTNVNEGATYLMGDHSFRFGGSFQNVSIDSTNDAGITPTYTLGTNVNTPQISTAQFTNTTLFPGGVPTAQRATANSLLALLGGIVSDARASFNVKDQTSGYVAGQTQERIFNFKNYGLFFNDSWRVRPTLTLSLGIRYDYQTPLKLTNGLSLEPILKNNDPVATVLDPNGAFQFVGGNAGSPGAFYKPDRNNFAPSLGFAWAPRFEKGFFGKVLGNGKTVLRGGFRMDYTNDELVRAPDNALLNNTGLQQTSIVVNPVTGNTSLNARVSALPAIPTPTFVTNRTFLLNNQTGGLAAAAFIVDPNIQTPRSMEFSAGIQRELGWNTVLEVRYVGSRSSNMFRASDFNQVDIRANGFGADFNRAVNNCRAQGATLPGSGDPLFRCTNAAFNAAIPGSVPLTVFPNLASGGLLTNSTILGLIQGGQPGELAATYVTNGLGGTVKFNANPNIFVADELYNGAFFKYHSLQAEVRRRFSNGLWLNANYTFEKELTNGQGTAQGRVEAFLDNAQPQLEVSRADYDQAHVFNLTAIYELPFGKGKRFFGGTGNWGDRLLGGWELTSIVRWATGAPISFVDARGTLNRAARSGRQTPVTSLTKDQLKAITGVFRTANGIFFIDPTVAGRNSDGTLATGQTGRLSNGFATSFPGQVLFADNPGTTSGLERAFLNGPTFFNLDSSIIKNIKISENMRIQLRGEFFNVLNHTQFGTPAGGQFISVNSATSYSITGLATAARISQFAIRFEF
jgi:hypothetical protein